MPRRVFQDGREIVFTDLNGICQAAEKEIHDTLMYELLNRVGSGFFGDSFEATRVSGAAIFVKAGTGYQRDTSQESPEPVQRVLKSPAGGYSLNIEEPHATLPRLDVVACLAGRVNDITGTRRYKNETTSVITESSFTLQTEWEAEVVIVKGTADVSPEEPAIEPGYTKLAVLTVEPVTGIPAVAGIADSRTVYQTRLVAPTLEIFKTDTTWECPVGVNFIVVTGCGGGGGGGGGGMGASYASGGCGGGGADLKTKLMKVYPGIVYTVDIGAGGAGGAGQVASGNPTVGQDGLKSSISNVGKTGIGESVTFLPGKGAFPTTGGLGMGYGYVSANGGVGGVYPGNDANGSFGTFGVDHPSGFAGGDRGAPALKGGTYTGGSGGSGGGGGPFGKGGDGGDGGAGNGSGTGTIGQAGDDAAANTGAGGGAGGSGGRGSGGDGHGGDGGDGGSGVIMISYWES